MSEDYRHDQNDWDYPPRQNRGSRYRDEVFSKRVRAGRRTYFFDVKTTRSGEDFFIVITESKRVDQRHEKHKIFVYKEDFVKFMKGLHEAMEDVRTERLPDYEFYGYPSVDFPEQEDEDE
ncbi:MAG: DUF3276 family protein [Bacteroidetes bacterium]|nr:DUF3276 family protein [Bacteroidota bacterium]